MSVPKIAVIAESENCEAAAHELAAKLSLPFAKTPAADFTALLAVTSKRLELRTQGAERLKPIFVDFLGGSARHRRHYGGGRGQLLARAVGVKGDRPPSVIDATAGLGQDAFVLACLGCRVTLLERSPIIAALLENGLKRAQPEFHAQNIFMQLIQTDAIDYLNTLPTEEYPEVIYLDPMFPESRKTALPKKEMRILRELIGKDEDSATLLHTALNKAQHRVVVKRPRHAPIVGEQKPDLVFSGESSRFDVYLRKKIASAGREI